MTAKATLPSLLAAVLLTALPASAQAPKAGDYFVDESSVGFKVKVPKNWDFVPGQPNEWNVIGKYAPTGTPFITLHGNDLLYVGCWLLRFDKSAEHTDLEDTDPDDEAKDRKEVLKNLNFKDVPTWIEATRELGLAFNVLEEKPYKASKDVPAVETLYKGKTRTGAEVHIWSVEYEMDANLSVALLFNAPAERKDWAKWKRALESMARTYKQVEVTAPARTVSRLGMGSLRAQKRVRLEEEIGRQAGWSLHETENYFVTTNLDTSKLSDKRRLDELKTRLEAIREVYEVDYPPSKIEETRKRRADYEAEQERKKKEEAAEKRKEKKAKNGDNDGSDEDDNADEEKPKDEKPAQDEEDDGPRSAGITDPMERSKSSVVRVCADRNEYYAYGGPGGSAGYWNTITEELVFYGSASGGTDDVWIVLNHEAFHQYIYYFYGEISPHSWYNEGTGDYYSGYQLDNRNRFQLEPSSWRLRTAQVNLRAGKYAPLATLVRWTQSEYYGNNKLKLSGFDNYAQGWAFVYFLRTGKANRAAGWNATWDDILDVYLDTLAVTGDLDKAVDEAFKDVDYEELESAWKQYTLDI